MVFLIELKFHKKIYSENEVKNISFSIGAKIINSNQFRTEEQPPQGSALIRHFKINSRSQEIYEKLENLFYADLHEPKNAINYD